jgi:hypothetical protein
LGFMGTLGPAMVPVTLVVAPHAVGLRQTPVPGADPSAAMCAGTSKWVLGLVGGPGWVMVRASFQSHAVPRPHTCSNVPHIPQTYRGPSAFHPPSLSASVADTGEGEADGARQRRPMRAAAVVPGPSFFTQWRV